MWENALPKSEESHQETTDVGRYFQSVTEGGKQYMKCLMKDCGRRFAGNKTANANLETHMNVAHNMNFHSTSTERPNYDDRSADNTAPLPFFGHANESAADQIEQNLSESADVRKYFQLITEDEKPYSKCLIKNCMRRIAGNHLNNLKRHLKNVHDAASNPWSPDDDTEVEDETELPGGEGAIESDVAAKVRQHFRIIIEDGKLYSKCLLRACRRRLVGNHLHNLKRHLNHGHNIKIALKPRNDSLMGPEKYFQRVEIDGKLFSKCSIKECDCQLAGDHRLNLEKHLKTVHGIKSYSGSAESLSDHGQAADNSIEQSMNEKSVASDSFTVQENLSDKLGSLIATDTFEESIVENTSLLCKDARRYFQCITENGKSYSRCLIRNCSRRIDGISKEKLTRHLCIAHKMSSEITDARIFFKCEKTNGKLNSVCLIQNCNRRIVGNHLNNLKKHLRGAHDMIIRPSNREMNAEMEDARKYFKSVTDNGKLFSKCLMDDCDCLIAGNHLYNLKRHIFTKHNINISTNGSTAEKRNDSELDGTTNDGNQKALTGKSLSPASAHAKTCRLCFEEKHNAIDIFSPKFDIARVIRLHFPTNEVILLHSENDKLITFGFFPPSYFHYRSTKKIGYRSLCARDVGRIYQISINFICLCTRPKRNISIILWIKRCRIDVKTAQKQILF